MVKPKAPLFGFGASGKLGDAIVYGSWKGIDVAREYVIPANPNSSAQSIQRGYFTEAVDAWHDFLALSDIDPEDTEAWNRYAGVIGRMSGFNLFTRTYVNERVAGGTPLGVFNDVAWTDTTANSMDGSIEVEGGAAEVVTMRWGNSKTFFPKNNSAAMSSGTFQWIALDSGYSAGTTIFYYFEVGAAGVDYFRSGLYTKLLT